MEEEYYNHIGTRNKKREKKELFELCEKEDNTSKCMRNMRLKRGMWNILTGVKREYSDYMEKRRSEATGKMEFVDQV